MKKGDRAGAIFRINSRRRVLALAGYGEYQGEDVEFNWDLNANIIKLDSGEILDTNTCHSWGTEESINRIVKSHQSRSYEIVTMQEYRAEQERRGQTT
jgi:hypothetical protein